MKAKLKKCKEASNDLGNELVSFYIKATVHENGLNISVNPGSAPEELITRLSKAVAQVLIDWNEMVSKNNLNIN